MRTRHFELLRPGEIIDERQRCPVIYVPIGCLEWHSLHLPVGTDPLNAAAVANQVAERVGGVVLPTFYWGTERERSPEMLRYIGFDEDLYVVGMDHPAHSLKSLYCREEFLALLVRELADRLLRLEYKVIAIVNGHGAMNQVATLARLCRELTETTAATVLLANAWISEPWRGFEVAHADAVETSLMMALHPASVDMAQLPPLAEPLSSARWGILDAETCRGHHTPDHAVHEDADPRLYASAELGREMLSLAVDRVEALVRETLDDIGWEPVRTD